MNRTGAKKSSLTPRYRPGMCLGVLGVLGQLLAASPATQAPRREVGHVRPQHSVG